MSGPFDWLDQAAADRDAAGLHRRLAPRRHGLLDCASNDYLALTRHPRVLAAAGAALAVYGAGSTGSRLVTGTTTAHVELETELAAFVGTEAALVFSSGYLANLGVLQGLAGRDTLVVSDSVNHASILDACRLSRATVVVVPHADVAAVDRALAGRHLPRALVVTDAVFSVDGDAAPLLPLAEVARRHGAALVVDEAHSLGVLHSGRGLAASLGLAGAPDVVLTATLSKALGSQGGVVLGPRAVIAHLVGTARPFIFDTGLAPASAAAAGAALSVIRAEPTLPRAATDAAVRLAGIAQGVGLAPTHPAAAVVAIPVGSPREALRMAETCRAAGVHVGCFRPPSVPDGISRLRLTARACLTAADFDVIEAALRAAAELSP